MVNASHANGGDGALRVLVVERDPVLRDVLAERLRAGQGVTGVSAVAGAREALDVIEPGAFDAALVDRTPGALEVDGYELGLALRAIDPVLPIVIYSRHPVSRPEDALPARSRDGWSYVRRRSGAAPQDLLDVLRAAAGGRSVFEDASAAPAPNGHDQSALERLSPRQREVIAMAATGLDARAIAARLGLAHVSVRRELSRAYKVLVSDPAPGTDLRTAAVLAYLRLLDAADAGAV